MDRTSVVRLFFLLLGTAAIAVGDNRVLSAATARNSLFSRDNACKLRNEVELLYSDQENVLGGEAYVAKVLVSSERPILMLEDVEDWLGTMECTPGSIVLSKTIDTYDGIVESLSSLVGGYIVTSHHGCNSLHERLAYRVTAMDDFDDKIELSTSPARWEESFSHIRVTFERTFVPHEHRYHREMRRARSLERRAAAPTGILSQAVPSFTPPPPSPSSASTSDTGSVDISFSLKDQSIPVPPQYGVALQCNNCSATGTISFTVADFSIDTSITDGNGWGVDGSVSAVASGVTARIDLSASIVNQHSFQVPVASPVAIAQSISVPGLGRANFAVGLFVAGGWEFQGTVAAESFGFDMVVPDGSKAVLNVSSFDSTSITGFQSTAVTPIPFVADAEISSLGLWVALRSTIAASFSFDVDEVSVSGSAGIYVDTPVLYANISSVQNVDENCQSTTNNPISSALDINFSQTVAFGAYAGFTGQAFGVDDSFNPGSYYTALEGPSPIGGPPGTQCRKFSNGKYEAASAGNKVDASATLALAVAALFMATW